MAIENLQTDFIFEFFIYDIRFRKNFANLLIKKGCLNRYTQVWCHVLILEQEKKRVGFLFLEFFNIVCLFYD
jgi:hypothetical protein